MGSNDGNSENTTIDYSSGGVFSWIAKGMESIVNAVTQGLGDLFNSVGSVLDYLNPFSENFILKSVVDFLGNILSYINPFHENFFGYKLVNLISSALQSLFIPNQDSFTQITDVVNEKFGFVDTIKVAINSLKDILNNLGESPSINMELGATKYTEEMNVKIIDMSWYKPYKAYGDIVLTALFYFFFLWRMFIKLPAIISGAGGAVESSVGIYNNMNRRD